MMNFLLWSLIFTFSSIVFQFSFQLSSVARSFEGIDETLAQSAVVAIAPEGHDSTLPHFNFQLLSKQISLYFANGLDGSVGNKAYKITYDNFRYHYDEGWWIYGPYLYEVRMKFTCDISGLYTYKNQRTFAIVEGAAHGT
jgi:hypothetical protein